MSALEQAKETMMLLITMFVLAIVSVFFYIFIGNFSVSNIDITEKEGEIVSLRVLKCIENDEKLEGCISGKYGAMVDIAIPPLFNFKTRYILNQQLYDTLDETNGHFYHQIYSLDDELYRVFVRFKK